jgi:hypothetical protein
MRLPVTSNTLNKSLNDVVDVPLYSILSGKTNNSNGIPVNRQVQFATYPATLHFNHASKIFEIDRFDILVQILVQVAWHDTTRELGKILWLWFVQLETSRRPREAFVDWILRDILSILYVRLVPGREIESTMQSEVIDCA